MCRCVAAALICALSTPAIAWKLDERPSAPGEWGFRPDSGVAAELNPPSFTWRPEKGGPGYQLQVSLDEESKDVIYEADCRWSSHCPPRILPEGDLYWRYRAVRSDGGASDWSKTRRFTIPANAVHYPQPTIAELKSRLPQSRPRLFMRPEDVAQYRALADGDLHAQWRAIRRAADKLLIAPPDTSDPPKYPKGTVRKSGEWRKIWWGNRVRAIAVADGAATLACAYRMTAEQRYGEAARDLLLALTDWDPHGATNFAYNDEAAMPILYMASRAYDWAYPVLSDDDRSRIIEMQRIRGGQCFDHLVHREHLWKPYGSHQNRAWHKLAELATAFLGEFPEAELWLDYALTVYFTCYPVWNDSDGGWHEGLAYWNSYISRFTQWAQVMERAYHIDAFQRPYFHRAGYFPMYLLPPGTQHGGFGDLAPRTTSQSVAALMNVLASGAGNPHWKWYAEQHGADYPGTYLGFFAAARARELRPASPERLPGSAVFAGTGVAALNTNLASAADNVQILFKSSPLGTISHGYNAQNTFQLNVGGKPLLQNTGQRDIHSSPHHTQWMWQARSQNVILVNGQGMTPDRYAAAGRVSHFRTAANVDVVAGEAGDAYPTLDRWGRRIVFLKPNVFLIHDVLAAQKPSTFQFLLHAPGKFDVTSPAGGFFQAKHGHGRVDFQFLNPARLKITQNNEYDPPPADWSGLELGEWHLMAATRDKQSRQEFLTLFRVNGEEAVVQSLERDEGFKIALAVGDATHQLHFRDAMFEVISGKIHWSFAD